MAIEKMIEYLRLHFRSICLGKPLPVTSIFCLWIAIAFGIDVGSEEDILAVRRPEFATCFGRDPCQPVCRGHGAGCTIEIRNPNLRTAFRFCREKCEALTIRRPARTISILIRKEHALGGSRVCQVRRDMRQPTFFFVDRQRNDPDMWRFRVSFEIDVDNAEDHPLAVGRNYRLTDALELHHVFESEGSFGLRECGKGEGYQGERN